MTNDEFLKKAFSAAHFLAETSDTQMLSIKGCDSTHLYCSPYLLKLMGAQEKEIIGKTVWFPLYDNDLDIEKIIREEDLFILNSRKPKMVFKINHFTTGLTPYICNKSPLINPETNDIVGILFQGFEIGIINVHQYLLKGISDPSKNISLSEECRHLSKREKQAIFLFMANLSSQEIAEVLYQIEKKQISKSGVDTLFYDQLYPKFKVRTRQALYKKLKAMGYDDMIPKEILISSSMLLNRMNVY